MAWVLVGVRAGIGMRAEEWQGVLPLHVADRGYYPPEEKSGVADSAGLRGRDADSPQLSAASVNSLRGVSGVPLRTWLPCRPGPGPSSGYTPCQGLDRASCPCISPHTFMFRYIVSTIVNCIAVTYFDLYLSLS